MPARRGQRQDYFSVFFARAVSYTARVCTYLPLWAAGAFAAVVFFAIWLAVWNIARKWSGVSFTPNGISFDPRHGHYMKTAEVLVTLASASLIFIPTLRVSAHPALYSFALVLLGACVAFCVLFMVALTYFYENFLYNASTYKAWRYGLVNALGFTALICFATAYTALAFAIASAVLSGSSPAKP